MTTTTAPHPLPGEVPLVTFNPPPDLETSSSEAPPVSGPPEGGTAAAAPPGRPPKPAEDPVAAPLGWVWRNGAWEARKPPGRPRKPVKAPRVRPSRAKAARPAAPAEAPRPAPPDESGIPDYRPGLASMVEGLVFVLGTMPLPEDAVLLGRQLPGLRVRTRVTAAAFYNNRVSLASSLQTFAEHNDTAHRVVANLASGGGGTWIIPAAMGLLPLAMQLADTWRKPLDEEAVTVALEVEAMVRATMEDAARVGMVPGEDHD